MNDTDKDSLVDPAWDQEVASRLQIASLYPFQKQAVEGFLAGSDVLVMVPTAGGKSFCYVIPALLSPGLVLVVSPLIALMRDQLRELKARQIEAASLDSMQTPAEKREVMQAVKKRQLSVLFVSPERLALPSFREFLSNCDVTLIAIDEAHCVNQWGHDFRPDYARLGAYLEQISNCPRMALTATATAQDRQQIISSLRMRQPLFIRGPIHRKNLKLKTIRARGMEEQKTLLLHGVLNESESGIVYTATRKQADDIHSMLLRAGVKQVACYHAGLSSEQRLLAQQAFDAGEVKVMVATKAFGMGINKRDIRFVHHASMPGNLDSYLQETGRAGRDGNPAHCYMFYGPRDFFIQRFMIEKSFPEPELIARIFQILTRFFADRQVYREDELLSKTCALAEASTSDVEGVLDFLKRDGILEYFDYQPHSWDESISTSPLLAWQGQEVSVDLLSQDVENRKQERLARLRAIHEMVKSGHDPIPYMDQYFR